MDQKLHDGIFNILGNTCFLWHNTPNTLFKSWIKLVIADIDGVDIGIVVQASQGRLRFLDDRAGIQGLALADGLFFVFLFKVGGYKRRCFYEAPLALSGILGNFWLAFILVVIYIYQRNIYDRHKPVNVGA